MDFALNEIQFIFDYFMRIRYICKHWRTEGRTRDSAPTKRPFVDHN